MKSLFLDSDIFIRDLRYPRDARTETNRRFLQIIHRRRPRGVTSIFNLLEVCGILSFNLSPEDLLALYADFTRHYRVQLLFPADPQGEFQYDIPRIFRRIQTKQSLGDAQVAYVVECFAEDLATFISWNAPHFMGKLPIPTMTPAEYLEG